MSVLNILVPMAGRGSRFRSAGFDVPKPLIPVSGQPMVEWALKPFRSLEADFKFIFVALREDLDSGLRNLLQDQGEIIELEEVKDGAVQSALAARDMINTNTPLLIANCDQYLEWDINEWMAHVSSYDAAVLAFRSVNPHHSYIATEGPLVVEVREKEVISDLAVAGVYFYKTGKLFVSGAQQLIESGNRTKGEFYISPIFNELLKMGNEVTYGEIANDKSHMLGTPEELQNFKDYLETGNK